MQSVHGLTDSIPLEEACVWLFSTLFPWQRKQENTRESVRPELHDHTSHIGLGDNSITIFITIKRYE